MLRTLSRFPPASSSPILFKPTPFLSLLQSKQQFSTSPSSLSSPPSPSTTKPSRTPLYPLHTRKEYSAKMVEFAGFEMPLFYEGEVKKVGGGVAGGPVAEHHQVRNSSGLFDVSHMVQSTYKGPGALSFLEKMLPTSLKTMGEFKSSLSVLLNPDGGIIDDCLVTKWGEDSFYLVTNAGRKVRDLEWITSNLNDWNSNPKNSDKQVEMEVLEGWGLVALQGPNSHKILQKLLPSTYSLQSSLSFGSSTFQPLSSKPHLSIPVHIARGGYTGEDGFEISLPPSLSLELTELILAAGNGAGEEGVKLIGLAARDSLRLEAGLCLYGHDLDESIGIGEAGLGWVVGKDRRVVGEGDFWGKERTLKELAKGGCERKRVGLSIEKGAPAREGSKIYTPDGSTLLGLITSGLPSPSLQNQNISMGYISTTLAGGGWNKKGKEVLVEVRKKMRKGIVVGMPFWGSRYYKI